VKFDYLLEYDTIYVQRLHDWESFYVLEKLKKAGRRIVYDMDDDIFSLTPDNPAFHVISRDNQQAAVACMKLADVVTTTTAVLQHRLAQVLDGEWPEIIPNALDVDDGWLDTDKTGSPDGLKRIFWQGSATHAEDWEVCIGAVDRIMQEYQNVHLVLLGYLPPVVIERLQSQQHWKGKVEHLGFNDVETYFQIIRHVRADVGIAPLSPKPFNEGKSPIRWLEMTCIGMPVVASNMEPYSSVIRHGGSGWLVNPNVDEWYSRLKTCLDNPSESKGVIEEARKDARECYDIKEIVKCWQEVLLPGYQLTKTTG
jgi:glycosyltransferase involved in cell wall biosynthesis